MIDFQADVLPLRDKIYRLALRITGQKEEAEDVVQDALLRVWAKLSDGGEVNDAEAFTLTVARHAALDAVGRRGRGEVELDESAGQVSAGGGSSPARRAEEADRRRWVERIVAEMPEQWRSVLHLRDVEHLSYKKIAEVLEISEDAVRVVIFRARQKIRKEYEKIERYGL